MTGTVAIEKLAARAWPALRGVAYAQPGTVIVGMTGETLRVREDGSADEVLPGGHPRAGAAADPCNVRRSA